MTQAPLPYYLTIIIPAYNDAEALQNFLPQVLAFVQELAGKQQVIIIDDGSVDDTKAVMQNFIACYPNAISLQYIKLSRNFGKESALSAGLAHAKGQFVAMIDADGQHPLSVLEQMLSMMNQQPDLDMIAGIQANRPHESRLARTLKSSFYHFIQDTRRYEIRPNAGDFRIMNQKVVQALLSLPERQRFMKGLYAWVGFQTVYLPFTAASRDTGESKFNYGSLFELALVGITSFSQKPLRLIARMGFVVSLLSILYGCYIVLDTLIFGSDVPGWATVAAGIMFSTGIQLVCIGVIGEYVGRLYEEVKQRPLYLIDESLSNSSIDVNDENDVSYVDNIASSEESSKQSNEQSSEEPTNDKHL